MEELASPRELRADERARLLKERHECTAHRSTASSAFLLAAVAVGSAFLCASSQASRDAGAPGGTDALGPSQLADSTLSHWSAPCGPPEDAQRDRSGQSRSTPHEAASPGILADLIWFLETHCGPQSRTHSITDSCGREGRARNATRSSDCFPCHVTQRVDK